MSNKNKIDLSLPDLMWACRHFGVRRFKNSSIELEFQNDLGPLPANAEEVAVSPEAVKPATVDEAYEQKALEDTKAPKVGADGLTAEKQLDFYNTVLDPELR